MKKMNKILFSILRISVIVLFCTVCLNIYFPIVYGKINSSSLKSYAAENPKALKAPNNAVKKPKIQEKPRVAEKPHTAEKISDTNYIKLKNLNIQIKKINPDFTPRHYDFNSIKIGKNKIMFVGGSHLASTDDKGNIDIFDTITNTCKKIKFNGDKKFISDDFENGIVSIDKNKIILSGHRVGFFDLKTNKISKFDEFTCGRDFFPILRDSNTLYRIWPNSENFGCSRGQCMGSHNYLQVLSTDLKTGVTKIINNFQIESSGFISPIVPIEDYSDPYYIKVDDNTVLIYTVGTGNTKNMILYSYNISENKFKKLIKIDNIGKNYDVTAQVLSDGTILFTGGVARQEGCDYMKSSEYMPSAIYNLTQNKIIKRPKMLYKNIPASFHEVCLIPLKNKDILVMESGTIRQYFDINSKEFKPIANPINIGKSSNQKVTVINDNSILISHGYIYDDRDSDKLNTTAWIVNY